MPFFPARWRHIEKSFLFRAECATPSIVSCSKLKEVKVCKGNYIKEETAILLFFIEFMIKVTLTSKLKMTKVQKIVPKQCPVQVFKRPNKFSIIDNKSNNYIDTLTVTKII